MNDAVNVSICTSTNIMYVSCIYDIPDILGISCIFVFEQSKLVMRQNTNMYMYIQQFCRYFTAYYKHLDIFFFLQHVNIYANAKNQKIIPIFDPWLWSWNKLNEAVQTATFGFGSRISFLHSLSIYLIIYMGMKKKNVQSFWEVFWTY